MADKRNIIIASLILGIVIIIVGIILAFYNAKSEITAKVILESEENTTRESRVITTCTDYENKVDYYASGAIRYCEGEKCSDERDSCSGNKLRELYCEDNERKYRDYDCSSECDSGACVNLVTDKKSISGSSGGGGGGGGSSSSSPALPDSSQTYDLGELDQENTIEIIKGDHIEFNIGSDDYVLTLEDNSNSEANINVGTKTFNLNVGAETSLDLNDNGASEFYIKLRSISLINGKAKLTLNLAN